MKESEVKEILKNLTEAIKTEDWTLVEDSIDYISEYLEDISDIPHPDEI
jgi:hypothetical protein